MSPTVLAYSAAALAIVAGLVLYRRVLAAPTSTDRANEIAAAIRTGAEAFLSRQYRTVAMVGVPIVLLLGFLPNLGWWYAGGFTLGAVASAAAGFIGMNVSVRGNVRVAQAAGDGFRGAFSLAFQGGAVTGLMVVGFGLLSLTIVVTLMQQLGYEKPDALIGLAFGGSLISVFARLGGGIFTKAADVGADLVGKVEANIPEDDPRNPAVIADNVGDNVGDCAGMAADLFETYGVTAAAAMLIAHILYPEAGELFLYPLTIGAAGIVGGVLSIFFVRIKEPAEGKPPAVMAAMYRGLAVAVLTMFAILYFLTPEAGGLAKSSLLMCGLVGAALTGVMMWVTDLYTGDGSRFVEKIARASEGGHGTNVISGLAVGMQATAIPVVMIVISIVTCHQLAGLYGVGIAAMSMLSLAGIVVAIDAYGPITDNAGGIAQMAQLGDKVRNVTDPLDAFGNTTKAVTKGYAIASAGLAAVVLFATYIEELKSLGGVQLDFALSNTSVLAGIFIGAMVPFVFASLAMNAVGDVAGQVVDEVRRQFREIPGIMEGTGRPDYRTCVDIVTRGALRRMVAPALIPVVVPVAVGLLPGLGAQALGGMLIGSIVSGLCVALSMTTGGAAWDNAKKLIESGQYGGKGSDAHKAAITGDTVGDPYKDTAGPAINPMLKLVNIVAILIIPFLA
ncbi:MAG: sodium-translocating pyrophosphatase [Proteobacteria bacterium]|nr:sodium-translocating pyrophosphatase [Pseudomonadota bacterium]